MAFLMFSLSSRSWHVKPGFHMIAAIAEKKKFSDGSDHMKTTFQRSQSEIELFLSSDRCRCDPYDRLKVVSI